MKFDADAARNTLANKCI